ncbi:MAG: hypothetical protein WEC73_01615 [Chthoniobacterales bacterium]
MSKLFLSLLVTLLCGACTAVEEAGTDVTRKFEQGIAGQGRLVSPDPTGDAFGPYYQ